MTFKCYPDNFIPLRGDCATYTEQGSDYYINDLPGLSFHLLANLSNEEQVTASEFYRVSHNEGIRRFVRDFKAAMKDKYNYKNVLDSDRHGRLTSTFSETVGTKKIGKKITKLNCWDRFQTIYIEYLEFNSPETEDTEYTFEIIDGCETTEKTVTLSCGVNRVNLNYEAVSEEVVISYDSTDILLPDTLQCRDTGFSCLCNGVCSSSGGYRGYTVRDVEYTDGAYVNSTQQNGLIIAASTRCSNYELGCIFKDESAAAIRYAIGIDILRRAQFSDRINPLVRNKKETIGEQVVLWDGGTSDVTGFTYKGEYHKELESIVTQAKSFLQGLTGQTRCIDCTGLRIVQMTP